MDDTTLLRKYGPRSPSIFGLVVMIVLVLVLFLYGSIAIFSRDALWFWSKFDAQPVAITVHCYGEDLVLAPGSPRFLDVTQIVNEQLSGDKRFTDLPLSDIEYYRINQLAMTLEIHYVDPVRIHSRNIFFSQVDALIIPLIGRHADQHAVFGMLQEKPTGGALHVQTMEPVIEYLDQNHICNKK